MGGYDQNGCATFSENYIKAKDKSASNMDSFRPLIHENETINTTSQHFIKGDGESLEDIMKKNQKVADRWKYAIKRIIFRNKFKNLNLEIQAARLICQKEEELSNRTPIFSSCVIIYIYIYIIY